MSIYHNTGNFESRKTESIRSRVMIPNQIEYSKLRRNLIFTIIYYLSFDTKHQLWWYRNNHNTKIYIYITKQNKIRLYKRRTYGKGPLRQDYSLWLAARVILYEPLNRQESTYHDLRYTSCGAMAGTQISSVGSPWSIRKPNNPPTNALPRSYISIQVLYEGCKPRCLKIKLYSSSVPFGL